MLNYLHIFIVFLFGRGGRKDLLCSYTFRGRPGERIHLQIQKLKLADGSECITRSFSEQSGHYYCDSGFGYDFNATFARVWISELPDGSTPLRQHCLCQGSLAAPLSFVSNTSILRLEISVRGMTALHDWRDFHLDGRFSFVHETTCQSKKVARGAGGKIALRGNSRCRRQPWVVEASEAGRYIFLKVPGTVAESGTNDIVGHHGNAALLGGVGVRNVTARCHSRDRIVVYSGARVTVICPSDRPVFVELFSDGWGRARAATSRARSTTSHKNEATATSPSSMIVRFVAGTPPSVPGGYVVQWLELSPTPEPNALSVSESGESGGSGASSSALSAIGCAHACPELAGCIGAELWCDGTAHCPSGEKA